ncbi:Sodium-dependent phosphate transporter [Mariniradius saccharolyticus AK6]|uniref:Sodium-dependent phosphate transporter n=1 Tax=Mariniradius saccharolyticus AK6 TaxID=1239962 RepID=M7XUI9_9BACT|nr:Na/Pi symporter [Mariniradius saccharolyticus]EMS32162.1 Sodium-dependent phosphate transporter [Mariniradius saccharolyticus AK6]
MDQESFDFWKFLAGTGMFMWGMHQLESAIREMAGKAFRNGMQRFTSNTLSAVLFGALVTAVLQSSSLVTLMVLAFLGAGVLSLRNAIGVMLGANLGTTMTSWIVATLGFKMSVESISTPFLGIGILLYLFFESRIKLRNIGLLLLGFGLMFLGLDFMKTSIEQIAYQLDLQKIAAFGNFAFLVVGIVVTALIQSSSAMVVIILSAMSAGMIGLHQGAILIIGANIGTTVTVGIGALGGTADKKRLALSHFVFNVATGLLVFFFVDELVDFSMRAFSVEDPLIELVMFNTLFNLLGIVVFFPFVPQYENWLKKWFAESEPKGFTQFIKNVSPKVPDVALNALEKEIQLVFDRTLNFIINVWDGGDASQDGMSIWRKILYKPVNLMDEYHQIKSLEDEITKYQIALQEESLSVEDSTKLTALQLALRTLVYSAKDIKDVMHNIRDMEDEEDRAVIAVHGKLRNYTMDFLDVLEDYMKLEKVPEKAPDWIGENAKQYKVWMADLYQELKVQPIEYPISTLNNVIKQVVSGLDNLCSAVIHWKHLKKDVIDIGR